MMTGNSKPTNWMPWAIVGALLGAAFTFMIGSVFGVVGFIFSREANNAYKSGKIIGMFYTSAADFTVQGMPVSRYAGRCLLR